MDALQWIAEVTAAKKRDKHYREEGEKILEIYSGKKKDQIPFNILFSNTETLLPALYSATPRPVVSRRFKDNDPIGKAASDAGERSLEYLMDTNTEGYETFDEAMRGATLDAILPGRGVTTVKYDAEMGEFSGGVDDFVADEEEKQEEKEEPTPYKKSELVCCETRSWNKVYFGFAKKWSKVPWICYEEQVDREEATRLFGAVIANQLKYSVENDDDEKSAKDEREGKGETKTACIWQVWDKAGGRKIRWLSPESKNFLKTEEDPLGLTGFFNCPKPLVMIEKSNDLTPTAPYKLYENQAEELNRITRRINKIVSAIRAKGVYDSELGEDIKSLINGDDNTFVPADKTASIAAEGGLQNAIWWWPVDKLIVVLQQLLQAREAVKATIFEIMGLADIMRGASQASETLGAQEIKQAWGGLRLKRNQKEVQRYARDLLRLMLEIAATKFSQDTWAQMTSLDYLTDEEFQQLSAQMSAMQQQMQMMQMQQQEPAQIQQQMQQLQQELQKPKWADVLEVLKNDIQRSYRVDIETNSTVEPEAVEDQKNIAEVMNALGQFLNGVSPLVAQGVMPFQAAQAMMLAIVRRFRFGDEIEDYILQMQAPKPPDDGKQAAAQAEQAKAQADQQKHAAELQAKQQSEAATAQREQQAEQNRQQLELAKLAQAKDVETIKAQSQQALEAMRIEAEKRANLATLAAERATADMQARTQQETELQKAALQAATQIEIASITATKDVETATAANEAAGTQVAQTAEMMERILAKQGELLAVIAAPKKKTLTRNPDGTSTMIEEAA